MPYKTEYVDAELFLDYKGVRVYHAYRNNLIDEKKLPTRFTLAPDQDVDEGFDVQDLETVLALETLLECGNSEEAEIKAQIRAAIDSGELQNPADESL